MPRKLHLLNPIPSSPGGLSGGTVIRPHDPAGAPLAQFDPIKPDITPESVEEIEENLKASRSKNTRRAYKAAMKKLVGWVHEHHPEVVRDGIDDPLMAILPLHVGTLIDFVSCVSVPFTDVAGEARERPAATATVATYVSAIRAAHRQLGLADPSTDPVFEETWRGIRRRRGMRQHAKTALRWELLKQLADVADVAAAAGVRPWSDPRILARDRALLLVGFAGAFRRSELVGLERDDVRLPLGPNDSLILTLRSSKTSDEPTEVEIPRRPDHYCPVAALLAWLDVIVEVEAAPASCPPLWLGFQGQRAFTMGLHASSVSMIVKRLARQAGLTPVQVAELASHSLRSGAATSAAEAKVSMLEIKDLGRWRSMDTVDRYVQRRHLRHDHPFARLK